MYTKPRIKGDTLNAFIRASSFTNKFFNNFPTKIVDGHEVLDQFTLSTNGVVNESVTAKNLYRIFNISIQDLKDQDYDGIARTYLYIKPWVMDTQYPLTTTHLNTTLANEGTETRRFNVMWSAKTSILDFYATSNSLILDAFVTKLASGDYSGLYLQTQTPLNLIGLLDLDENMYTRKVTGLGVSTASYVKTKGVGSVTTYDTVFTATITVTKKETPSASTALANRINSIDLVNNGPLHIPFGKLYSRYFTNSNTQLFHIVGSTEEESITYVKVAGLRALRKQDIINIIPKNIETDYQKESANVLESFVMAVVTVAIVVGAFLTGQWYLAATVLTIGGLALSWAQGVLDRMGSDGIANDMASNIQLINKLAEVAGYFALIGGLKTQIAAGFTKQMSTTAAQEAGRTIISQQGQVAVVRMTALEMANQVLNWLNTGFGEWSKYQMQESAAETTALQAKIAEQEAAIDDLPTPKKYTYEKWNFESYNFLEINEKMEAYTGSLGSVEHFTKKYF